MKTLITAGEAFKFYQQFCWLNGLRRCIARNRFFSWTSVAVLHKTLDMRLFPFAGKRAGSLLHLSSFRRRKCNPSEPFSFFYAALIDIKGFRVSFSSVPHLYSIFRWSLLRRRSCFDSSLFSPKRRNRKVLQEENRNIGGQQAHQHARQ